MTTPEGRVKTEIKRELKARGDYFFMPVPGGYGAASVDILVCSSGRFIAIECKRPGGKPTARQKNILREIAAAGGLAVVATCWAEVLHAIESNQSHGF